MIPGGDQTGFDDFPNGMLSEYEYAEPLYAKVKRWHRSCDRCAGHFQGEGDFLG